MLIIIVDNHWNFPYNSYLLRFLLFNFLILMIINIVCNFIIWIMILIIASTFLSNQLLCLSSLFPLYNHLSLSILLFVFFLVVISFLPTLFPPTHSSLLNRLFYLLPIPVLTIFQQVFNLVSSSLFLKSSLCIDFHKNLTKNVLIFPLFYHFFLEEIKVFYFSINSDSISALFL